MTNQFLQKSSLERLTWSLNVLLKHNEICETWRQEFFSVTVCRKNPNSETLPSKCVLAHKDDCVFRSCFQAILHGYFKNRQNTFPHISNCSQNVCMKERSELHTAPSNGQKNTDDSNSSCNFLLRKQLRTQQLIWNQKNPAIISSGDQEESSQPFFLLARPIS